ncbi:hypothetical protein D9619_013721 [Psilocybe cf. subviscida]|uniref:Transmembrane protein n=1 Tax=Psilocybe cf. subviscida TaxID=2480587 RepID=A0A8H5B008_9AGAR|nr:hypothetical protein D9619_013721 [Psilocybe cf. subviscida]
MASYESLVATVLDAHYSEIAVAAPLYGIYHCLFVQAMWKLVKRRANVPYVCALVLLWMCVTSSVITAWVKSRNLLVVNSSSLVSILVAVNTPPGLIAFLPLFMANVLSNGILIWRCYVLWHNLWIIAILITLLLASSACTLYLALIPFGATSSVLSIGVGLFLSAATTVCATAIISLRIILVTRKSHARYSYTKIIQIVVQSAALESFVLTLNSTISFAVYVVAQSRSNNVVLVIVLTRVMAYTSACRMMVMGIAPTLIAVRVAEETPRTDVDATSQSERISRLTFRRSTHHTDTDDGAQRTGISTMQFDSARIDDPDISAVSATGADDVQIAPGRKEIIQNTEM